jgi:CubicO group peptidase (beta-lactamase class C family)
MVSVHRQAKYAALVFAMLMHAGCAVTERVEAPETVTREVSDTRMQAFLQRMVKEEHFTGVALVAHNGEVIHAKGYGAATTDLANDINTAFHVASITKQFTAAAIMQLVEAGSVKLDGSINDYLPQKYRSEKWEAVTIHHLLSHSSGIPDYAVSRDYYHVEGGFCSGDTVDRMIEEAKGQDLEFKPGAKYSYTNLGYTLLGAIIEAQTETPYAEYLKRNILEPMQMRSSRIHGERHTPAAAEAHGFRWSEEQAAYVPDETETLPATAPDGGLITTLSDFLKWVQIYMGAEQAILTAESIDTMRSPQTEIGGAGSIDSMGYGLGIGMGDSLIAHSGHIRGFRSQFVLDRQTRTVVAVFSNNTTNSAERIAFGLLEILFTPT